MIRPLAIQFSSGLRGDFLAKVLLDEITIPTTFHSYVDDKTYKKLHKLSELTSIDNQNYYVVKIKVLTVKEALEGAILTGEKNEDYHFPIGYHQIDEYHSSDDYYKFLYTFAMATIMTDLLNPINYNYSFVFDYCDFNDITKINKLYREYRSTNLTTEHVEYIRRNNELNDKFLLKQFENTKILGLLDRLTDDFNLLCEQV